MTEAAEVTDARPDAQAQDGQASTGRKRKGSGLEAMVLPELKQLAATLGLKGTGAMRKGQLIEAIRSAQGGTAKNNAATPSNGAANTSGSAASNGAATSNGTAASNGAKGESSNGSSLNGTARPAEKKQDSTESLAAQDNREAEARNAAARANGIGSNSQQPLITEGDNGSEPATERRTRSRQNARSNRDSQGRGDRDEQSAEGQNETRETENRQPEQKQGDDRQNGEQQGRNGRQNNRNDNNRDGNRNDNNSRNDNRNDNNSRNDNRSESNRSESNRSDNNSRSDNKNDNNSRNDNRNDNNNRFDDDEGNGGRRGRRRRNRDRQNRRNRGGSAMGMERYESEPTVSEDDVLVATAGILDVMDNYAFVRTTGYLPGDNDAYVSLSMVKKFGLRKGDVMTGVIRQPRDGERKEKFNPLVRIETVNGDDPEKSKSRPEFNKLTPLYPQERLRLETEPNLLIGRLIDIIAPIGKGQRGLIVAPSKAGKTTVMQQMANAITTNSPDVHLMVVLVDERPEEVTEMQRAVKGEVIASTFDRPADDHTTVAELAIERAKRLVELGHDVVVLLDSITKLGRAYNLAAPASGRILSGGVDSAALYPPKRFFGAARNIEDGGSLTILATALIETGSKMDEVIFEEFKGTGNMELRLRREFADKRVFPAIDVDASSTRREELLMGKEELAIIWKLRRVLSGLEGLQGLEMLIDRLKKTQSNHDFLSSIVKSMPATNKQPAGE